jgi:CrcB protein
VVNILLIGVGGFCGSVARYLASGVVQDLSRTISFPWGTFAVNVLGCFLIGFIAQLTESRGFLTEATRGLIVIGFLGGFTTFSTFGNETYLLLRNGQPLLSFGNAAGQLLACLAAVWLGRSLAIALWR